MKNSHYQLQGVQYILVERVPFSNYINFNVCKQLIKITKKLCQFEGKFSSSMWNYTNILLLICFCFIFLFDFFLLELGGLIKFIRPFLKMVSKAKAAKLVRNLVDIFLDMEASTGMEVGCLIDWLIVKLGTERAKSSDLSQGYISQSRKSTQPKIRNKRKSTSLLFPKCTNKLTVSFLTQ